MAITGFTGTSQLNDTVAAEQVSKKVVSTAYASAVADNFISMDSSWGGHGEITGSTVKSYTRLGALTASELTEGTDATATALSDTQVSATITEWGIGTCYGDLLRVANSTPGGKMRVAALLGKAYAKAVDTAILALASSFSDSVGAADALTLDEFLQAIHELEDNDCDGPYGAILHTSQVHYLRAAIGGTSGSTAAVFSRLGVDRIGPALINKWCMNLYEVDIWATTLSDKNASETAWVGMMLPMTADMPIVRLIGRNPPDDDLYPGQYWDGRYEEERDASGRLSEMWVTGSWGVNVIATDYGVGILSAV